MRWHVEAVLGVAGSDDAEVDSDATVEAESWQRALQAGRALRGERTPMSGFSTETLADGSFRAVDPIKKITFTVRKAGDDATLGMHKAPKAAASAPSLPYAGPRPNVQIKASTAEIAADLASSTLLDAVPPPANLPLDSGSGNLQDRVEEEQTVPLLPALDPDATDETMATMPLPSASALEPVILFRREQSPSPAAPLHYREYVLALPLGTNEEDAEIALRRELARVQEELENEPAGKLVALAAFDEMFTGPPTTLPLVTLTWKDWRGEPVIDRPRRRGTALPVQPMSFPPPAPPSAPAEDDAAPEVVPIPAFPALPLLPIEPPIEPPIAATSDSVDIPVDASEPHLPAAAPATDVREEPSTPLAPESDAELPPMRRQADSLIGGLFEQMHELAFLKDAIEGAHFCLDLALKELPALGGVVHLYDMERRVFEVIAVRGDAVQGRLNTTTPDGDPRFRTAAREGVARGLSEAPRASASFPASLSRITRDGSESIMAPIVKDGRYLGAIELVGSKDGAPLGDDVTNALTYIAGQYAEFVSTRGTKFKPSAAKIASRPPVRGR